MSQEPLPALVLNRLLMSRASYAGQIGVELERQRTDGQAGIAQVVAAAKHRVFHLGIAEGV
jgi:hypothetical protein